MHEQIARGLREHPAKKGALFNGLVTVVEVGGSLALFHLARLSGASNVASYLVGSIGPLAGGLIIWVKARKFSGASAAIFSFTVLSAIIALIGSTNPRVLLYKDCASTAVIGLLFAGSCVLPGKPLVFYMAQRYGTDGTHDGMELFDTMWTTYSDLRLGMYVISCWWAALFLMQAAGTAFIVRAVSYSVAYDCDQLLPLLAIAFGLAGSLVIGRHYGAKGKASSTATPTPGT